MGYPKGSVWAQGVYYVVTRFVKVAWTPFPEFISMDTTRFILFLSLVLVWMMLWQAWEQDYGVAPDLNVTQQTGAASEDVTVMEQGVDVPVIAETENIIPQPESTVARLSAGEDIVSISTDVFNIKIDKKGAGITHAELINYPIDIKEPDKPFVLMDKSSDLLYINQGGILSAQSGPTHEEFFDSENNNYVLQNNEDVLIVPFSWESRDGIRVNKIYEFYRGSYLVNIRYEIENNTGTEWQGRTYSQIKRIDPGSSGRRLIYTYTGAVISSPEDRYEKIDFSDMQESKLEQDITNGWFAMIQHYFLTALIPADKNKNYRYYTLALPQSQYAIGMISPPAVVNSSAKGVITDHIYIGPKEQDVLEEIAEGLNLTVDYGVLWFIAKPLFWCLGKFYELTANWGWSIILVTILLKIIFYRLSAAGYRSMANMRRVQPRIMALRDRYKNDKARLNQAMMQIYKEEKINPLGGCFPILIQIPVFIALYWVLLESVELRQASFILWLQDLSSPDPYWVLPITMGVTMFIQQKLNPAPMDPVQEKVMMIMPFAFTIFFGFFPSGLVLYWVANNILSIAQQWMIMRNLEKAGLSSQNTKQ